MKNFITWVVIILILIVFFVININKINKNWNSFFTDNHTFYLTNRWILEIPLDYEEKFYSTSNMFRGEGYVYIVAKYETKESIAKLDKIDWSETFSNNVKYLMEDTYSNIEDNVPSKYKPNIEEKNFLYKEYSKDDGSQMLLIYEKEKSQLYIFVGLN